MESKNRLENYIEQKGKSIEQFWLKVHDALVRVNEKYERILGGFTAKVGINKLLWFESDNLDLKNIKNKF